MYSPLALALRTRLGLAPRRVRHPHGRASQRQSRQRRRRHNVSAAPNSNQRKWRRNVFELAATVKEMTPQRICCLRAATPPQPLAMQHTAGASALKASVTGTVYSVVAVYTAAAAATKCSGAAITAEAGATDSADTVATNSAPGAIDAHMAGAGAAGFVSTDAVYVTTDVDMAYPAGTSATRETTGTVVVFSSTDQTQGQVPCVTPRPLQKQMQCAPSSTQMLQALLSWCDVHHHEHWRCDRNKSCHDVLERREPSSARNNSSPPSDTSGQPPSPRQTTGLGRTCPPGPDQETCTTAIPGGASLARQANRTTSQPYKPTPTRPTLPCARRQAPA